MSYFINNGVLIPEVLDIDFKSVVSPILNFTAVLLTGPSATVNVVGNDGLVYMTFTLDTLNTPISSGLVTNLPRQLRYVVTSGIGQFRITLGSTK
jgi:hypothetical protein